jgi:Fe-S cluster biogenesis protein NfuA
MSTFAVHFEATPNPATYKFVVGQTIAQESRDYTDARETDANDSADVALIKRELNEEIRPAVAMDGGDVLFEKYEDNVVYLHMRGSCAGCPSSTMTLKMGIETRLKEALPAILEVVSL